MEPISKVISFFYFYWDHSDSAIKFLGPGLPSWWLQWRDVDELPCDMSPVHFLNLVLDYKQLLHISQHVNYFKTHLNNIFYMPRYQASCQKCKSPYQTLVYKFFSWEIALFYCHTMLYWCPTTKTYLLSKGKKSGFQCGLVTLISNRTRMTLRA